MSKKEIWREKWYFDACGLDEKRIIFKDALKKQPVEVVVSHLSIGEACGNCFKKGSEEIKAVLTLLENLGKFGNIKVVGNDYIGDLLDEINEEFSFSPTDAMHLATAIKEKCTIFKTTDRDFCGLPSEKKAEISKIAKRINKKPLKISCNHCR